MQPTSSAAPAPGARPSLTPTSHPRRRGAPLDDALLLAALAGFTEPSRQTQELRAARQEQRQESRAHRSPQDGSADLRAAAHAAERNLRPGSAAFARHERQAAAADATAQQGEFRDALQQAQDAPAPVGRPRHSDSPSSTQTAPAVPALAPDGEQGTGPDQAAAEVAGPQERPADTGSPGMSPTAAPPIAAQAPYIAAPIANTPVTISRGEVTAVGSPGTATGADGKRAQPEQPAAERPQPSIERQSAGGQPLSGGEATKPGRTGVPGPSTSRTPGMAEARKDDANIEHIVRVVTSRKDKEHSTATIRLDPPWLGSIRMHIDLRDGVLLLRIEPDTQLAHRLLSENLEHLRRALDAAGIQLSQVEFRPPPGAPELGGGSAFEQMLGDQSEQGAPQGTRDQHDQTTGKDPRHEQSSSAAGADPVSSGTDALAGWLAAERVNVVI